MTDIEKVKSPRAVGPSGAVSSDQVQTDYSAKLPVSYTVFQSSAPLSKAFSLDNEGTIIKTPAANMTSGRAKRVMLDFAEFGDALNQASEREAFCYGLHDAAVYGAVVKIAVAGKANPDKKVLARTRQWFDYRPEPGLIMLDHDPNHYGKTLTTEELREILAKVYPAFAKAAVWVRGSVSSGVCRDGDKPKLGRGFYIYLPVANAADIPRFGRVLFKRLWLAGHGFIALSSAGSCLVRSVIDAAVFDGERLDFVGMPVIGAGLSYYPPKAEYRPGGYLDTSSLLDLTAEEEQQLTALISQAKQAREPERQAQRAEWEKGRVSEMVEGGASEREAKAQVQRIPQDGKAADLYRDWVLGFAQLGRASVGDVLKNPAHFDGQALADPIEGTGYGRTTAKFYANSKEGKPYINSHAHGSCRYFLHAEAAPPQKPERRPDPPFDGDYYAGLLPPVVEDTALLPSPIPPHPANVVPMPKRATASPPVSSGKATGGQVVAIDDDQAQRQAFARKIDATDDFGVLVYELAPAINLSTLRKTSKASLL